MSLNALVVDDSSVMRRMIIKTLGLSGVPIGAVHQAANGAEGLEVLNREQIDLALVDINMPVMGGAEMIERIRANPKTAGLAIIVISTDGSAPRIEMMHRKRAGFVHKPFSPEVLRDRILEAMGGNDEPNPGSRALPGDGPDF